jgi:hypothetical protein
MVQATRLVGGSLSTNALQDYLGPWSTSLLREGLLSDLKVRGPFQIKSRSSPTLEGWILEDLKEVVRAHKMSPEGSEVLDIGNPSHRLTEDGVKACLQNRLRVVVR